MQTPASHSTLVNLMRDIAAGFVQQGFFRLVLRAVTLIAAASMPTQATADAPGSCPQPRFTDKAPAQYLERSNPLPPDAGAAPGAESLYNGRQRVANCAVCHGSSGDGKGPLATLYDPPPRNFSCAQTIDDVPDGQLFWIIRFGSAETAMPAHPGLNDKQIWQLVSYLRQLTK